MATTSYDSIFGLGTTQIMIPPGATLGVLVEAVAGQNSIILKYLSGGTLYVMGVAAGATLSAADLAGATGHYLVGTSEILNIDGPARFYLASLGATTVVCAMRGKSQGV